MEIVITIAEKIVECTIRRVGRWLCYSFHYSSNIDRMKNKEKALQDARKRVQHSINSAIKNGEEIEDDVTDWLNEVDKINEIVKVLEREEEEAKMKCSNGACQKLKLRHQLSKKAEKLVPTIDEALGNSKFARVSYCRTPQGIMTTRSMDYVDFESRKSTMEGVMEALRDDNIQKLGLWGMIGMGKTTLAREVANQAKEKQLFSEVAFAKVGQMTQIPNLGRIQEEIADALDLKFDKNTSLGRASRLRERLSKDKNKPVIVEDSNDRSKNHGLEAIFQRERLTKAKDKKILVILDDIWNKLNLEEIGIPLKGCKILLISTNKDVLSEMGTQKDFRLEALPKQEAWSLFEKMVGDCVKDSNLRCTATEVAETCKGLPLALVTVSMALKNKQSFEWMNALDVLRRPAPEHLNTILQSPIYSSIEMSYNHLDDKEARDVVLLCAQLSNFYVDENDLLKYCYGLGLFDVSNTMNAARNRLCTILRMLKDHCLMLDCPSDSERLCMHDVVRDVGKSIASRDDQNMFVVGNDGGPTKWPDVDKLKRCKAFSVLGGDIHELKEMECPELRFLFVYCRHQNLQISDTFFEGMRELRVIDITKMKRSSLPSSLYHLQKLQTLCLDHCELGNIDVIGELKNLVVLSLMGSNISILPSQIRLLTRLQLLDLSKCRKLQVIPPNVLSRLEALEELYMGNSIVQWEAEGLNNERNNASLAELRHLSHLTVLEIHIRDANNLPIDLLFDQSFEKLERYVILVGDVWEWSDRQGQATKTLKLKLDTNFKLKVGIKKILKRTEKLWLDKLKGVKSVLHELNKEGFEKLKHLHIQNNCEIKYIISSTMSTPAFPSLETLVLKNMPGLEEICHGQLPLTSFCKLKVLRVENCEKLKFVFSSSIIGALSQLEELEIVKCSILGAIVMKEEGKIEDQDTSLFLQLRHLALEDLDPKLIMSFLRTQNSLATDAGEIISEGKLDFHMEILHGQIVFPKLEMLKLSIALEDIDHNQHREIRSFCKMKNMQSISRFQNLLHLELHGIDNIKYLVSFSTAKFMEQLKYLHMLKCVDMEDILGNEDFGVVEEIIPKVLFPQLEVMILEELPILKRFCEGSNIKFPSLKKLSIYGCPKLKTFISKPVSLDMMMAGKELKQINAEESSHTTVQHLFNEEVAFPSLEYLVISGMDDLNIIWGNQFAEDSFYKLQGIEVEVCENLVNIFQVDIMTRFRSLEELTVRDCESLQEVYDLQGLNVEEAHALPDIQLEILDLENLPNMKHVWNKDPQEIFDYRNLQMVQVVKCESLKSLFPATLATCLTKLEELVILDCKVLEEIVAEEESEQQIARFVFPRLTIFQLAMLPRLKWFYPRVHTSEWPNLKDMLVAWCPKVEIFASQLSSFQAILQESQPKIPTKQPLFLVDKVPFLSLEKLRIFYMANLKIIWHNQFTVDSFSDPQIIKVEFCQNLTHQETCDVTATHQLKELHLLHLPKLKHIWNKDRQDIFRFQNPHEVLAIECESMESDPFEEVEIELRFDDDDGVLEEIVVTDPNSSVFPQECILQIGRLDLY